MTKKKSNNQKLIIGVALSVLIICLIYNMNIKLTGFKDDGDLFLGPLMNKFDGNYFSFLVNRYNTWSSRVIIEFFTLTGVKNPMVWKLLNSIMMAIAALLPVYIIKRDSEVKSTDLIFSAALFFTLPMSFFSETGWVATTTNYLWVFSLGIVSIYPLIRYTRKEKELRWLTVTGIITTLYAANQEQMALLLLTFTLIIALINWFNKQSIKPFVVPVIVNIATLIFVLTTKGNDIRYQHELRNWFPDFEQLSFFKKVELGYSSTVRHLYFDTQLTILTFLFIIFILAISRFIYRKRLSFIGLFGLIPFSVSILFSLNNYFNSRKVVNILNQFNQYGTTIQLNDPKSWIPDLILTMLLFSTLLSIIYLLDYTANTYWPLLLLCAAGFSRLIMGFSPTVWASATRTYLFTYCLVNLTSLYLFTNVKISKQAKAIVFTICIIAGIAGLYLSYTFF
ncbi:MAG: DUF6056 family protein [Enterococcus hulanensis]